MALSLRPLKHNYVHIPFTCTCKSVELHKTYRAVFHMTSFSVHIRFATAMLVYYNVQYSLGEKHFHRRYGATQAAICPSLALVWQAVICIIICKRWTISCLHYFIATLKVLFAQWVLYIVVHQHGHRETDMHGKLRHMKLLYQSNISTHTHTHTHTHTNTIHRKTRPEIRHRSAYQFTRWE